MLVQFGMKWSLLLVLLSFAISLFDDSKVFGQRLRTSVPPHYFKAFQSREDNGNLTKVVLRNGLTILIEEHALDPLVAVVTYVRVESQQENYRLSRLMGQLYLHRSEATRQMQDLGTVLKIKTDRLSTVFSSVGPADNTQRILELHADLLLDPQIDPDEISVELELLLAADDHRRQTDMPEVTGAILQQLYPSQVLVPPPVSAQQREALVRDSEGLRRRLSTFHSAYYHPKNVVLTVSGHVRREQVLETIVASYSSIRTAQNAVNVSAKQFSLPNSSFNYEHRRGNVFQPRVLLGYRVPGWGHDDHLVLRTLNYILNKGRGSLLGNSLGSEGVDFEVETELKSYGEKGVFWFKLRSSPEQVDRGEVRIVAQLEALRRQGIPVSQIDRAKALLFSDHYQHLQNLEQRAYLLCLYELAGGYAKRDQFTESVGKITEEKIVQVLDRYFRNSNLYLSEYFPEDAEPRTFTSKTFLEVLELLIPVVADQLSEDINALQISDSIPLFQVSEFKPNYLKHTLKKTSILRGPEIYFQEEHAVPLVHAGFFYPGGRIRESEENAGITELMLHALMKRATAVKAEESFVGLERLGMELNVVNEIDFFGFSLTAPSSMTEKVIQTLIRLIRSQASLEEGDLEWARRQVLQLQERQDRALISRLLSQSGRRVFEGHSYGLSRFGSAQTVSSITFELLHNWITRQIQEIHPLIVVKGDVEGTAFLQGFISRLSDREYQDPKPIQKPVRRGRSESIESVIEQENGSVVLAFPGPAKGTRDEATLDLLDRALRIPGGVFSSLRNRNASVHHVEVSRRLGINGGVLFVHLNCPPGKEDVAGQELMLELGKLSQLRFRQQALFNLMVGTITQFHLRQQNGQDYLLELVGNILSGQGVKFAQRYLAAIKNTRLDDLEFVARRYWRMESREVTERPPTDSGRLTLDKNQ